jgi:hypothetical protein
MPKTSLPDDMGNGNAIVPDLDEKSIGSIISNEPAANDGGAATHGGMAERKREERGNTPPEEEPGFGQGA